jgi:hypothetical protein
MTHPLSWLLTVAPALLSLEQPDRSGALEQPTGLDGWPNANEPENSQPR